MTDNTMRTVICWITKEDHLLAHSLFNAYSSHKHNALLAGDLLMMGIRQYLAEREPDELSELDAKARLRILDWETRRRATDQATLNSVVARGSLSEEEADQLHNIAIELDLDEEEAVRLADSSLFASAVAQSYSGTQSGRCLQWLAKLLIENPDGIMRQHVMTAGEQSGFSERMLDRVSRKLGVVKHKETGGKWFWYPPDEEESDPESEPEGDGSNPF